MGKTIKIIISALVLITLIPTQINAKEDVVEITNYDELVKMKDNPNERYILMNDIDLAGKEWVPFAFEGEFDGNGYSLLNLNVTSLGKESEITYDGNYKTYDTYFSGVFSTIIDAKIENLSLVNEHITIVSDKPCFIGGIAGYSDKSEINNCVIENATYKLKTSAMMNGIAGVVGYGNGSIDDAKVDVSLICVDTDVEHKDEHFLAGVLAAGFMNINHTTLKLAGYDSNHGYVHDGGLVGMYIEYAGTTTTTYTNNNVSGEITFYEDNIDRRAYCAPYFGETMGWSFHMENNTESFVRNETYDYTKELAPDMDCDHQYTKKIVIGDCESYGYTLYHCEKCKYEYKDNYTLKQHKIENSTVIKEASSKHFGLKEGTCSICGKRIQEAIEKKIKASFSESEYRLDVKEKIKLKVHIDNKNVNLFNTKWTSSNEKVVKVNDDGTIEAMSEGEAVITFVGNNEAINLTCKIKVGSSNDTLYVLIGLAALLLVAFVGKYFYINRKKNML